MGSAHEPARFGDLASALAGWPDACVYSGVIIVPGHWPDFVKMLPDGQPVQLTHDGSHKMSPVFSPDGTRVAYTTVSGLFDWDTWVVPVLGGESELMLRNASGLTWTGSRQVLF